MSNLESALNQIRERAAAATPGPWEAMFAFGSSDLPCEIVKEDVTEIVAGVEVPKRLSICSVDDHSDNPTPNFRFIAHARTDVPKLLKMIEALLRQRDKAYVCSRNKPISALLNDDNTELLKILEGE